jgi:hypothetical protein
MKPLLEEVFDCFRKTFVSQPAIEDSISKSVDVVQLRNQLVEDAEIFAEQFFFEDIAINPNNGIIDEEDWESTI